jgi:rubrerythrin
MAGEIESCEPSETYPGEYMDYLRAYAGNIVFAHDELEEMLEDLDDIEDAVEFAMQREIESILYYIETKTIVPSSHGPTIDKIVEEERGHYLKLVEIRKGVD